MDTELFLTLAGLVGLTPAAAFLAGRYLRKGLVWLVDTPDRKRRVEQARRREYELWHREMQRDLANSIVANLVSSSST